MAENVPVRCPSCRREHRFTAPSYPCVCGAPVAPRLDRDGTVTPVAHRVWQDDWVAVRCERCGRRGQWPRPEVGCPCGTVLRVPLAEGRWVSGGGSTGQDRTSDDVLRPGGTTRQDTAADHGLRPGGTTGQDTAAGGGLRRDRNITVDADAEAGREGATDPGRATCPHDAASAERAGASAYADGAPASARAGDSAGADADVGAGAAAEVGGRRGADAEADAGAGGGAAADAGGRGGVEAGSRGGAAAGSRSRGGADAVDRAGANPGEDTGGRGGGNAVDRAGTDADDAAPRPPFRSVTIHTALDTVTAAALYLRWLGYRGVRRADQRPPYGIGLAARGVVALVDPAVRPATLRDVECLWLTAMTESADCLYFSLAGYADDARARADALGIPLFVLDLTGTPRPVNAPAGALDATGTENRAP